MEKKQELTKRVVEGLKPPASGQYFVWDAKLPGFGVRVTPKARSYILQARVNGKTRRVKIGSCSAFAPEVARKQAVKVLGEMAKGVDPVTEKAERESREATLRDLWEQYRKARQLRPKTEKVYESALIRCFSDWLDKPFLNISKDAVQKRHDLISRTEGRRSNTGGARAQANQAMRVLRSLLNFAAATYEDADGRSLLPENPVRRLSQARCWNENRRRKSVIDASELKPWFDAVQSLTNETMRDYLILCILTGLRRNEAAALKWTDINLKERTLKIEADRSKNHEMHVLPLPDYLFDLLSARQKVLESPYVFPSRTDSSKHLVESKFSVAKVTEMSGVPFMVHDLRRTFLTIGEALDVSHVTLKKLANHKAGDITSSYIVSGVERLREPMQAIENFILEKAGVKGEPSKRKKTKRVTATYGKLEAVK